MLHCLLTIVFNQMFVEDVSSRFGGLFENVFFPTTITWGRFHLAHICSKGNGRKWVETTHEESQQLSN